MGASSLISANATTHGQTFTSSGTFTPPAGTSATNPLICTVVVTGGGGGGAGYAAPYPGNGGNAAALFVATNVPVTAAVSVTVGAAGTGGIAAAAGGSGGATMFGPITAAGGAGGLPSGAANTSALPAGTVTSSRGAVADPGAYFIAITSGAVYWSRDGITWVVKGTTSGTGTSVAVSGLVVVVCTGSNVVSVSTDGGLTFTPNGGASGSRVTYGAGLFLVLPTTATGIAYTSPDAVTWTQRSMPAAPYGGVTYGGGQFVAVGGLVTASTVAATSPDGITWTARTMPTSANWSGVTYANGLYVATCSTANTTQVATSPDGITWTARTVPSSAYGTPAVYGNGIWVIVGTSTVAASSSDGLTWTARTLPISGTWNGLNYSAVTGAFMAFSSAGAVVRSTDGVTWTQLATSLAIFAVVPLSTMMAIGIPPVATTYAGAMSQASGGTAGVPGPTGDGGRGGDFFAPLYGSGTTSQPPTSGRASGAGGGGAGGAGGSGAAGAAGSVTVTWSA